MFPVWPVSSEIWIYSRLGISAACQQQQCLPVCAFDKHIFLPQGQKYPFQSWLIVSIHLKVPWFLYSPKQGEVHWYGCDGYSEVHAYSQKNPISVVKSFLK